MNEEISDDIVRYDTTQPQWSARYLPYGITINKKGENKMNVYDVILAYEKKLITYRQLVMSKKEATALSIAYNNSPFVSMGISLDDLSTNVEFIMECEE
jgi:hypothetical protein